MFALSRRAVMLNASAFASAFALGGCTSSSPDGEPQATALVTEPAPSFGVNPDYVAMYGPVEGERFPIPAVDLTKIDPAYLRTEVDYTTTEPPGTIIVDPQSRYLYFVQPGGRAIRYGVGVGKQGFEWSGEATINSKQEWPDWYPPAEMIARRPDIKPQLEQLQSGMGVPGGPRNPIGARGHYLWQNGKDTLYRIHGTTEPWTIGTNVSSGCIRMINQDVIDLYNRTTVGTRVVVVPANVG
jgi:lipoprotein-anchoring transpeptidase ErfK/SrfK